MRSCHGVFIVPFFCGCLSLPSFGQQKDSATMSEEYFRMGMEVFDFTHRKQSTELFVLAVKMNPKNAMAQFMAGKSILLTIRKEQSLAYFKRAFALNPKVDEDIQYYIGQGYQHSEKFDSAILSYERYIRWLSRTLDLKKSVKINEVNRRIFECRNAKIFKDNPVDVTLIDLGTNVNSEWPDYAPNVSEDESLMVFTSRRPDGNMNPSLAPDHEYYEDIYYSVGVQGDWQPAKNIGAPLNTEFHNASVNLSPDGKEMFIYNDAHGGDLFSTSLLKDGTWSSPKSMDINTEYIENSATITKDGQRLYFTSDRPGGYGGTDIYTSVKDKNGNWTDIKNMGPVINTELDEEDVFISSSGAHLYFSSNGLAGMGDMDIYQSIYDSAKGEWGEPKNLGYPINSVENDIYFVLSGDEQYGYFSSVKAENKGEQDIYKIDMRRWKAKDLSQPDFIDASLAREEKNVNEKVNRPSSVSLEIVVVDEATLQPLDADVNLVSEHKQTIASLEGRKGNYRFEWVNATGLKVKYQLTIAREGYSSHESSLAFYLLDQGKGKQVIRDTIKIKKSETPKSESLKSETLTPDIKPEGKKSPEILHVFFANDSSIPASFDGIQNVEKLMKDNPAISVEISGHTDNKGPSEYNLMLSCRRAEAVRNFLIRSGIDPSRIKAAGYGQYRPVADNAIPEGRKLNRRTEFIIIGQ